MPYTRLFYHLVWSTKNRLELITLSLESCLFSYLCLKAGELECKILAINGWSDHIHLVIDIPPNLSVSEVVKRLKGSSSHHFPDIKWQRSYGALTVSERSLEAALGYVNRQKEHHENHTHITRYELFEDDLNQDTHFVSEGAACYSVDLSESSTSPADSVDVQTPSIW